MMPGAPTIYYGDEIALKACGARESTLPERVAYYNDMLGALFIFRFIEETPNLRRHVQDWKKSG